LVNSYKTLLPGLAVSPSICLPFPECPYPAS
jgi:hypothetical protein